MDYFGINSPADLPKLKEIFNDAIVDPTVMNSENAAVNEDAPAESESSNTESEEENEMPLVVTENGELTEQPDKAEEPGETNEPEEPQDPNDKNEEN